MMEEPFNILPESAQEKLQKTSQPDWLEPMLATLTHERFSDPDWIYERKLDGERCLVFRNGDDVRLLSRNREEINTQYPELADGLAALGEEHFILDGEIVAFDPDGISSFERLQARLNLSSEDEARQSDVKVFLYLFDILYLRHYNTTRLPLRQRKQLLKQALSYSDLIHFLPHRNEEGERFFEEACQKGCEGIIAEKADSTYKHSRSRKWLKFKCVAQEELVIGGYTEPHGERIGFGALLLGYYEEDKFRYAGKVGTGFDDETLRGLHKRLSSMERKTPPFDDRDLPEDEVHWVTPKLVAEIGFEEWTKHNKLRQPRYLGLRRDKPAEDVVKEG
jgi:bifunctional non-homologous end joining protein LigD